MVNEPTETPPFDMASAENDARLIYHLRTAGVGDRAPELRAAYDRLDVATKLMGQQDLVRIGLMAEGVGSVRELRARAGARGGTADGNQ